MPGVTGCSVVPLVVRDSSYKPIFQPGGSYSACGHDHLVISSSGRVGVLASEVTSSG